ncbi:FG-GAP-like repeat-containing protein [Streptomyces sp. BK79]|uniref:FG-GAP-like repeat-containing protein n=1 Tax=Streptomyces sp. BK79 TaxID=3350097 RepID=UPI00376FECA7
MRQRLIALLLALAGTLGLAVGTALPAHAIIGGALSAHLDGEVQIFTRDPDDGSFGYSCVGTLIDTRWVLTARHCLIDENDDELDEAGVYIMAGSRTLRAGTRHDVASIRRHADQDAALLELTSAGRADQVVKYSTDVPPVNENVSFRGWGPTSTTPGAPTESRLLRVATARVSDNDTHIPEVGPGDTAMILSSVGLGLSALGDSGAGVYWQGTIHGIVTGGDESTYSDALKTAPIAGWIESESGVAPASVPATDLRVLPLGDSITYGTGSSTSSSYRAALYDALKGSGHTVDFVGTQNSGSLADTDNEGHPGWVIDQIAGITDTVLSSYRPNVVTLDIGTNDMNLPSEPETAPDRLGSLIDRILDKLPGVTVVVATVGPASNTAVRARMDTYNEKLAEVVENRRNAGKHVLVADMSALTTADLSDGLHPNDTGYGKMADVFHGEIRRAVLAGWVGAPQPPTGGTGCTVPGGWLPQGQIASGVGATAAQIRFADINGDGRDDYLVLDEEGAVRAWLNNGGDSDGTAGWIERGQIASGVGANPAEVQFADVNGDGRDDYLVVTDGGAVRAWLNNGGDSGDTPGWIERGQIASGVGSGQLPIVFADIDGDAKDDYLVLQEDGSVLAWLNNGGDTGGTAGWIERGRIASGVGAPSSQVEFADANGDGRDDYLVVDEEGAVRAWLNNGGDSGDTPGWIERGQIASGVGVDGAHVRFADMNADDYRDDYLTVSDTGAVSAWLNNCGDPA